MQTPGATASSRPWWYRTGVTTCGTPALVRVDGQVIPVGDRARIFLPLTMDRLAGYWRERLGRNLIQATMAMTTSSQGENRMCRAMPRTVSATMAATTRAMMASMVIGFL